MKVVLVKYNAGNYASVENALKRLGVEPIVTDNEELINSADRVIFPGVGEANSTMNHLQESGLDKIITSLKQPVLGICLGMQLLCSSSDESFAETGGATECLGIFPVAIRYFITEFEKAQITTSGEDKLKIPHMGWNSVQVVKRSKLFEGISDDSAYFYFANSFFAENSEYAVATCNHGINFSVALEKDNFCGVQFHPEKSCTVGAKLIENFIK